MSGTPAPTTEALEAYQALVEKARLEVEAERYAHARLTETDPAYAEACPQAPLREDEEGPWHLKQAREVRDIHRGKSAEQWEREWQARLRQQEARERSPQAAYQGAEEAGLEHLLKLSAEAPAASSEQERFLRALHESLLEGEVLRATAQDSSRVPATVEAYRSKLLAAAEAAVARQEKLVEARRRGREKFQQVVAVALEGLLPGEEA